jgi:hypothetical protein
MWNQPATILNRNHPGTKPKPNSPLARNSPRWQLPAELRKKRSSKTGLFPQRARSGYKRD